MDGTGEQRHDAGVGLEAAKIVSGRGRSSAVSWSGLERTCLHEETAWCSALRKRHPESRGLLIEEAWLARVGRPSEKGLY